MSSILISLSQYVIHTGSRLSMNLFHSWSTNSSIVILDANKNYVIAANHMNSKDPFFIIAGLPLANSRKLFPIRFMTYSGYYFVPLIRPLAFLAGCFPTKSKTPRIPAGVSGAVRLLSKDSSVLIFPEGKRVSKQGDSEAHSGLARILSETDENTGLLLAKIYWSDKKHFTITYKIADELKDQTSQQILDAIYRL